MFNDSQHPNNQNPPVDDIFAETDKTQERSGLPNSEIETHRAGLISAHESEIIVEEPVSSKKGGGKWFKIIIILIVVVILGLVGYLVYGKFFQTSEENNLTTNIEKTTKTTTTTSKETETTITPTETTETSAFASSTSEITETVSIPEIPGVNVPLDTATQTDIIVVVPPVDSDSDGLTDDEEALAGTNINIIDTDTDGLSDYEEIKIYQTNPLSADSDGDGYLDGAEVAGGYNPNGPGKLPGLTTNP